MLFFLREQNAFGHPISVHEVRMKSQSQQGLDAGGVLSEKSIADTDLPDCSHVISELQKRQISIRGQNREFLLMSSAVSKSSRC